MNSITCECNCCHCKKRFEVNLEVGDLSDKDWYYTKIEIYCSDCRFAWEEADKCLNSQKLVSASKLGELSATHGGRPVPQELLAELGMTKTAELQARLMEANIKIDPPDWWHIHLGQVAGALVYRDFSLSKYRSILFQVVSGSAVPWTRPEKELPLGALPELLEMGAIWYVVRALDVRGKHPRSSKRLCNAARKRLHHKDARVRFEALWVLMGVDLDRSLYEFLTMAADLHEHPRVRGLAIEGLKESLRGTSRKASWVRRALKLVERLLSDSEPEVRWWACYFASHLPSGNSINGHRYLYRSNLPLLEPLRRLLGDTTPAGLGWSINTEARDAIANLEGRGDFVEHPMWFPYDPWGSV